MRFDVIGELLRQRRLELGLSQEDACDGICTSQTLSRIECGWEVPTQNVQRQLLKRLKLREDTCYALEWEGEEQIEAMERGILACDTPALAIAWLEKLPELDVLPDIRWHQKLMGYRCQLEKLAGIRAAEDCPDVLLRAIRLTDPDFSPEHVEDGRFTQEEVGLIDRLALAYAEIGQGVRAAELYGGLLAYLRSRREEARLSGKLLPEVLFHAAQVRALLRRYAESAQTAEDCRAACVRHGCCQTLPACLTLLGRSLHFLGRDAESREAYAQAYVLARVLGDGRNAAQAEKELGEYHSLTPKALLPYLTEEEPCPADEAALPPTGKAEGARVIPFGELLRCRRVALNYSQGTVCRGICKVSSYSRIEYGEQTPGLTRRIALLQRLGLTEDCCYALLSPQEVELEARKREIINCNSDCSIKEGFQKLAELEKKVDAKDSLEQQFILRNRIGLGKAEGRYTNEEQIVMLLQALRLTIPAFDPEELSKGPYTEDEVKLIIQLANTYTNLGNKRKAADIFYQLLKYLRKNWGERMPAGMLPMALFSYARTLDIAGRYAEGAEAAQECRQACIRREHYQFLPYCLAIYAECCHFLGKDAESLSAYTESYVLMNALDETHEMQALEKEAFEYHGQKWQEFLTIFCNR